jgi:hypothetical protein
MGDIDYSLSDKDIQDILEPDTKVFQYSDLKQVKNINDIFDKEGRCIMLYTTGPSYGHWINMIKRGNKRIDYFDSYGKAPDAFIDELYIEGQTKPQPLLTELLRNSKIPVYYNTYDFQSKKGNVATCGRWAVARLANYKMSLQKFYDMVMKQVEKEGGSYNPDKYVVELTYPYLGK